jgi:hypothetical protein
VFIFSFVSPEPVLASGRVPSDQTNRRQERRFRTDELIGERNDLLVDELRVGLCHPIVLNLAL